MIERLRLLWRRYSPLEQRFLQEVRRVLPATAQTIFDAQAAAVNHVQRLPSSWAEISFYRMRWWKVDWSGVPLFPCTDEVRLAEVRFRAGGISFKGTLLSLGGHIFDLTLAPGCKSVAFLAWDGQPSVTLLADPLRAPRGSREPETLPRVWERVVQRGRGQLPSGWLVHDHATAYRVALDDGEYLILAERDRDQYILHRIEPAGDSLFYLDSHDGVPERIDEEVDSWLEGRLTNA